MKSSFSVDDLVSTLSESFEIIGSTNRCIESPSDLKSAQKKSLTFCKIRGKNAVSMIKSTKAKVVICSSALKIDENSVDGKTLICVENPRLAFVEIIQKLFPPPQKYGISSSAIISENADIHPNVYIGPHSYIGDSKIGEGSIIYGNVYIYSNVTIGRNVTIHTGTTIGVEDAFAYERNVKGELIKFPHFGGVIIEDDVDIHVHVNIDRGTFGNTIIGQGSKINRYAHIGHNGVIGKHCQIGGQVFIAGSCNIGDYCELALSSCIRNSTQLGKNVMVGMGSVVTKDVEDDLIVFGVPAKKLKKNKIFPWRKKFDQGNSISNG